MKIGILTYHNAYNYGAVLQCYALQEYVKSMGHEVEVIDYRNKWVDGIYKPISITVIKRYIKHPKALAGYIKDTGRRWHKWSKKKTIYRNFVTTYLNLSNPVPEVTPNKYDAIIIGSDQMWGLSCLGGRFDNTYLGDIGENCTKLIGYAISTDKKSIHKLCDSGQLKRIVNRFQMLSFRESVYTSFVIEKTHARIVTCVDPTILLSKKGWDRLLSSKWNSRNYVAIYQVRKKPQYEDYIDVQALNCAKMIGNGCEVINLNSEHSVEDFVSIIKNAQLVITSSFHATAFSVIFGTKFYSVILNDGYDDRYVNLLENVGLQSRLIEIGTDIKDVFNPLPQYSLYDTVKSSVEFLKKALS